MRLLLAGGDGEDGFPSCRVSGEVNFLKNNNKKKKEPILLGHSSWSWQCPAPSRVCTSLCQPTCGSLHPWEVYGFV